MAEGIVWPNISVERSGVIAALVFQMEHSEIHSPDGLFDFQRRQLKALFEHAAQTSSFYGKRFEDAGLDPRGEITPESIRRLPPLTRSEFQAAADTVHSTQSPKSHGKPVTIKTSGTTGLPVVLRKTQLSKLFWLACLLRDHMWQRRDPRLKAAVIRYMEKPKGMAPRGLVVEGWGKRFTPLFPEMGRTIGLNIASSLQGQAEWLISQNPAYLMSYPSNLKALAEYFEENDLTLTGLRQISTISEVLTPHMRELFRRIWGVPTTDSYSCEEAGYLAIQCPEHDHYHVQSANVYLEVVDENGEPCPPGVSGRVLITSLHNFATPLIRYELGDYAVSGVSCPCKRGSPVLERILGRARNRLILPDGRSEFPYFGQYRDYAAISTAVRKFQFVQNSLDEIEKKMVVSEPLTPEQEEKTKELILRSLGHPFRVILSYYADIPRGANGKFEEFVSKVELQSVP